MYTIFIPKNLTLTSLFFSMYSLDRLNVYMYTTPLVDCSLSSTTQSTLKPLNLGSIKINSYKSKIMSLKDMHCQCKIYTDNQ
jgi:hypothetical protein